MLPLPFRRHALVTAALLLALPLTSNALPERAGGTPAELLARLSSNAGGTLTSNAIPENAYNTVYAANGAVLLADNSKGTPTERAQYFLSLYGGIAGVTDSVSQLQTVRVSTDVAGNQHVHMDQYQSGLPVFGARLVVHINDQGITGMNGVFVKGLEGLSTTPAQSKATLQATALRAAQKLHPGQELAVESSRLMFYNTGLLQGREGSTRLAYEVMVKGAKVSGIRERMILDANQDTLLFRINEIHTVLNRKIYTPVLSVNGMEAPPVLTEGGPGSPADPAFVGDTKGSPASSRTHGPGTEPLENLYIYAGGTYNLYKNLFGIEGYDFTRPHSPQIQKSVYLANQQCPNAYWDGTSTNYCPGFDADDVVSHEWSHAYTEYTHGLIYAYQSGALNESYSDIFGETYDLIDGFEGPLGASLTEGAYYPTGSRWVVGEDLSDAAAQLLLRDMWDPDSFPTPSPGSVITSANYYCGTSDAGGVHTNSGVSNHAYAMLVDGKAFNGVTVPAIGMNKAAAIYSYAEVNIQTPTTNYPQHADALDQACSKLIGQPIKDVFGATVPAAGRITAADCDAVKKVSQAVEFRGKIGPDGKLISVAQKCGYVPVLKPESTTPPFCGAGKVPKNIFKEDFEASAALPAGWTTAMQFGATGDTDIPNWTTSTDLPLNHKGRGRAAFFKNQKSGTCAPGGDQTASHTLTTPDITMPADYATNQVFLRFNHFLETEATVDGGQLKVNVNGATATTGGASYPLVPAAAFVHNAHSSTFAFLTPVGNNTNNLNYNQLGWSGIDAGEASSQWGWTIVDLSKLATKPAAGQKVKFRFDFTNDGCNGDIGWLVDDVSAYQCVANAAPVAKFKTVSPVSGTAPVAVSFDASSSFDSDDGDSVASYTLDFGDGTAPMTQRSAGFSHTYQSAGDYTAKLTVTDSYGTVSAPVNQLIKVAAAKAAAFSFLERKDVPTSSFITSETVTLSGFTGSLPIKISGASGQYSINGGAFTADAGTIKAGDKLVVRHVSSADPTSSVSSTVTVGTDPDTTTAIFKSTTAAAADHVPDAFNFGTKTGQEPSTVVESDAITLTGYDSASVIAGPGVAYSINGKPFTTAAGTLVKGDTLKARHTTTSTHLGYTKTYVKVGGVTGYFTTRTK